MLLPALGKAREKAKQISCVNNLKSVGLYCALYSDSHDDYIARTCELKSVDTNNMPNWGQYLQNEGYVDPANEEGTAITNRLKWGRFSANTFLVCPSMKARALDASKTTSKKYGIVYSNIYGQNQWLGAANSNDKTDRNWRRVTIKAPANFIYHTDTRVFAISGNNGFPFHMTLFGNSVVNTGAGFVHNGKCNIEWLDGHVTSVDGDPNNPALKAPFRQNDEDKALYYPEEIRRWW